MATRAQHSLGTVILLLLIVGVGCPPSEDDLDDDTSDDDDSIGDGCACSNSNFLTQSACESAGHTWSCGDDDDSQGDDDAASNCTAPAPPYTFEFSGDHSGTFVFDDFSCTDYNGDEWSVSYVNSGGWQLRMVAGPLAEGESLGPGTDPAKIDITLQNNSKQAVYSGGLSLGHVASVEVERYQSPSGPCGWLTTDPLLSPGAEGGSVSITPQPIPFNCPN